MKIGPWEINVSSARKVRPMEGSRGRGHANATLYLVDHGSLSHPSKVQVMNRRLPNMVETIVFPTPNNMDDPWERLRLQKLVSEIAKWWEPHHQCVYSCDVSSAIREFGLVTTPETKDSLDKIYLLSGVKFNQLEKELYASIPHLVTHIFSEGQIAPPWMRPPEDQPTDTPRLGLF